MTAIDPIAMAGLRFPRFCVGVCTTLNPLAAIGGDVDVSVALLAAGAKFHLSEAGRASAAAALDSMPVGETSVQDVFAALAAGGGLVGFAEAIEKAFLPL